MLYQHAYDDSGKKLAADLSARALAELAAPPTQVTVVRSMAASACDNP